MLAYKLKFLSALHVDSKGSGSPETAQEFVHSDSLSAALCVSWPSVHPEIGSSFFASPDFLVSSAFPYIKEVLFFPVPRFRIWGESRKTDNKEIKQVRWISQRILEDVLHGEIIDPAEVKLKKQFAYSPEESEVEEVTNLDAWKVIERQRVSVDRLGGQSEAGTFFFAQQHFHPESGLFFMVDAAEPAKIESVLGFLGDSGLGADRNSGLGHFKILDRIDPGLKFPENIDGRMTLSLFNPGPEDNVSELTRLCAYDLMSRSGWVTSAGAGRPPIRVFAEGSFFAKKPSGRVVRMIDDALIQKYDLPLSSPIYRDFRAFSVPCATPSWYKEAT